MQFLKIKRLLRIILTVLLSWMVVYYCGTIYQSSLIYISPDCQENDTSKEIAQHSEHTLGTKIEQRSKFTSFVTACDLVKSGKPLDTTRVINQDPYLNVIIPKMDCNQDVYLVVYVHSSTDNHRRRDTIRRTWGNVSQYSVLVHLVFIVGTQVNRSSQNALKKEIKTYGDIVQSDFMDTYRNLSHKAIAGLKWIMQHCRSAKYVLKTDDDAFVNIYLLLRLLQTKTETQNSKENMLLCNVCNVTLRQTAVTRRGKWKTTLKECSLSKYPSFCQGIAFVMTMNVALALYDASKYVPLLWMDDVYLTGLLPALLPPESVVLVDAETFYMSTWSVKNTTSHEVLAGTDAFKFIYYHEDSLEMFHNAWSYLKRIVQTQMFSNYTDALFSKDTLLDRKRIKNVTCTGSNRNVCYSKPQVLKALSVYKKTAVAPPKVSHILSVNRPHLVNRLSQKRISHKLK